ESTRIFEQRSIATTAHVGNDLAHLGVQRLGVRLRRPRQCVAPFGSGQGSPLQDRQLHTHASIFSTGNTRMELAPARFRLSRVSQNTFSRHTAWTATMSLRPSSG